MSTSQIKVYDLEVFPNYFLAGFQDVKSGEQDFFKAYSVNGVEINELSKMLDYIKDKWLVGFNSRDYDNQIIHYLMKQDPGFFGNPASVICYNIYRLSSNIIEEDFGKYKWDLPFKAIDLKRVGNIDKSLKMCGVDLKWHTIQDLIRPHDKEVEATELQDILDYNINDLGITNALYHELREDITMRQKLSVKYKTDLMDYADSGMADRLLEKFYAERTGLSFWDFKNQKTERSMIDLDDIIVDKIRFSTEKMKQFLVDVRSTSINVDDKFQRQIEIGNTRYDMLKGGLHSVKPAEIFQSTEDVQIREADVSSYYPNFMINHGVKPAHLRQEFLDILKDITYTRLKAKKNEDWVTSGGLKITINSVFG